MPYKFNPFTGSLDETSATGATGATGTVSAAGAGTAAAPSISFAADTDTGLFNSGANVLDITTGGTAKVKFDNTTAPLKEIFSSVYYPVATQIDIGTDPNQIPINGYLGTLAFQDSAAVNLDQATINTATINTATISSAAVTAFSNVPLLTGGGFKFPPTQVASADPNTLDDYEEGSFTMSFFDAATGGNQSATTAGLNYTKIGRLVHVYGIGSGGINTTGMTSGNILYITLPFAVGAGYSGGEARLLGAILPSTGTSSAAQLGPAAGSRWYLHSYSAAGGVAAVTVGNLTSGVSSVGYISIVYQAS